MSKKIIGLTGGIGAGKSFVSSIFHTMGIPIYDSDSNAKRLMQESPEIIKKIKSNFGQESYLESGQLNRKIISAKIFKNSKLRTKINQIVHPIVRADFKKWAKSQNVSYVINEAALFVENGSYADFNALITVLSPLQLRIKRVNSRSNLSEEEIQNRIQSQSTDAEKISKSDFLIYNDYMDNIFQQIKIIHNRLETM